MQNFNLDVVFGKPLEQVDEIIANIDDHVRYAQIPKKSGDGMRTLTIPSDDLKAIQSAINYNIMYRFHPSRVAHGFVRGRSTVTGAIKHLGSRSVFGADIKGFFDHITKDHARNVLFGNSRVCELCKHCARGCTPSLYKAAERQASGSCDAICEEILAVHDPAFVASTGYQSLMTRVIALTIHNNKAPQGFPTSPALGNIVLRGFDKKLVSICQDNDLSYTRYADDITISSKTMEPRDLIETVLDPIRHTLYGFGFHLHPDKTRVHGSGRRQTVTGIIVNGNHASIGRNRKRKLRALVHLVCTGKLKMSRAELMKLKGDLAYMAMVSPQHRRYLTRMSAFMRRQTS